MSTSQQAALARIQLNDLVMRFFRHYDRREYPPMYALMTPDAVWNRPDGAARVGPELDAALAKRPASLAVAHLVTNLVADVTAPDRAAVHGLMTVYRDEKGKLSPGPAKLSGPGSMIDFTCGCRKIGDDWKIATIDVSYLFKA